MTMASISRTLSNPASWPPVRQAVWKKALFKLLQVGSRRQRRLRLAESLSLGDRRFVAVVEFENSRFLLGGTSTSLVLLARLKDISHAEGDRDVVGTIARSPEEEQRL